MDDRRCRDRSRPARRAPGAPSCSRSSASSRCLLSVFSARRGSEGQQRLPDVAQQTKRQRTAIAQGLRPDVDLHDACVLWIELPVGKVGPQHQQRIAFLHRGVAGREADQPGHADIVWIVVFDMLLAAQGVNDRRLQLAGKRQKLRVRAGATGPHSSVTAAGIVQEIGASRPQFVGVRGGGQAARARSRPAATRPAASARRRPG